jgi:hypothetical protein
VRVVTDSSVKAMRRGPGGVEVVVAGPGGDATVKPRLILGCDGANSAVRASLREWASGDAALREAFGTFETTSLPCISAGLRFKVLPLPANPKLKDGAELENPGFVLLQGGPSKTLGRATPIRLGLLPFKEPDMPRTGNLITEDGRCHGGVTRPPQPRPCWLRERRWQGHVQAQPRTWLLPYLQHAGPDARPLPHPALPKATPSGRCTTQTPCTPSLKRPCRRRTGASWCRAR